MHEVFKDFLVKPERKGSRVVGSSHPAQFRETALRSIPCMLKCFNQLLLLVFTLSLNLSVVLFLAKNVWVVLEILTYYQSSG